MKRQRDTGNILTIGIILLVILLAVMFSIGRLMREVGLRMNYAVAEERSLAGYSLLQSEFEKSVTLLQTAAGLIEADSENLEQSFASSSGVLFGLDEKISRAWLADYSGADTVIYIRQRDTSYRSGMLSDWEKEALYRTRTQPFLNEMRRQDNGWVWSMVRAGKQHGKQFAIGSDISLPDIFSFMINRDLTAARNAYITIYSPDGTIIFYPDSLRIGTVVQDSATVGLIGRVAAEGTPVKTSVISEFLLMPSERAYYALELGDQRWVVALTMPHFTFTEMLEDFNRYAAVIVLSAVLLFTALLAYSHYRIRREHARRLRAEQQSAEQQMNRLMEQVKPHFLFNALNSLYSLIKQDAGLARRFVLKLAGMYRYVLERRSDPLATVEREIDFTCQYMFLQETRFGDQIELDIRVSEDSLPKLIPSLSLQGLVENAIKHNAFSPDNPLRIRIFTDADTVVVENDRTDVQRPPVDSTGLGLESLRTVYRFYTSRPVECRQTENTFRCVLPLLDPTAPHS